MEMSKAEKQYEFQKYLTDKITWFAVAIAVILSTPPIKEVGILAIGVIVLFSISILSVTYLHYERLKC